MIVRSIKVCNWRCFLDEVAVGPFEDGLNVVHGPNGTGKSRLFEALQRAILDGHKVTGKSVKAIRPWGRALAPKVTVELEHEGQEYRITKQFLDSPSALIERKEGDRYRRLAEGAAADKQTREFLTKNPAGSGLARVENSGTGQILWAPQGKLAIAPLSGDVRSHVRNMLSAQVSSAGTGPIEKRIEECYGQFFSTTGRLRGGSDPPLLIRLKKQLDEAKKNRQDADEQYLEFEKTSRRVEEFVSQRTQARHDAAAISKTLTDARVAAGNYRQLVTEQDQRSQQVDTLEAQYKGIKQSIDLIRETEKELADEKKTLTGLEIDAPLKDREVQHREKEASRLKKDLEDTRKDRKAVDSAAELAEAGRSFNECSQALQRSKALISNIEKAERALDECRKRRNSHVAPDARTMKEIRRAAKDRDEAQVRIEASLITLEIVPENDGSVDVVTGETLGSMPLKAGAPTQIKGSPEVVADLPQVARLRARGPEGSVEEHREARTKAEQKLLALSKPYSTSDLDSLDALADKATELDASVAKADTKLKTLLTGQTMDKLEQERTVLETTHGDFLDTYPEWKQSLPNSEALEDKAVKVRDRFIVRVEHCEAAWTKAEGARAAVSGHIGTLSQRIEDTKKQVGLLTRKLANLTIDGKSLQERDTELEGVAMDRAGAKARLADIQRQLAQYVDDPKDVVERLEDQLEVASQASGAAREQEIREEAKLEGFCAKGPYSALAVAEEKVTQLEQDVRCEKLRVEAIRLLHDTVAACRTEEIATVSGPVEAAATSTFHRIAGRRLGSIQIGDAFEPAAVIPETVGQSVTLENLSGGEQEQLYLATRLALAEVLGKEERQLVVWDDVLIATDSGRLARVMSILEEAAQRLQVLVLTCHPERYRALQNTSFFDLEDLVR